MLENVITGKVRRPRRVMLYGTHGIGKSTWAASTPSPIYAQCEQGLDDIGVARTPLLSNYGDFQQLLGALGSEQHEYRTLVIDTFDALEVLIRYHVCTSAGKVSIEDFGYGKGFTKVAEQVELLLRQLDWLRDARQMGIVLLSHAKMQKIQPPGLDPYLRYQPDLYDAVSQSVQEWCDEVLFVNYRTTVLQTEGDFNKVVTKAVGDGERIVYTQERPTHLAKRRLQLPDEMPLDFSFYAQACAQSASDAGPLTGSVVDGSSKQGLDAAAASN